MPVPAALWRAPRVLKLLAQHGASALEPKFVYGRYHGPMISPRKAAALRKRAIIEGTFGSFSLPFGGWDPAWDTPRKMFIIKPSRGHLRERTRQARADKITTAMKAMPEKIEKYRQDVRESRPKKTIAFAFKRAFQLAGRTSGAGKAESNLKAQGKSKQPVKKGKKGGKK